MDLFGAIMNFFTSAFFRFFIRLFVVFLFVLWASLVYWTYRDAKRRGAMAGYWAAVVLIFNVLGWLVYLVLRPPEYLEDAKERELEIATKEIMLKKVSYSCPGCHRRVEEDFLVCPYCFKKLKKACPKCGRALNMSWTICPYCKEQL